MIGSFVEVDFHRVTRGRTTLDCIINRRIPNVWILKSFVTESTYDFENQFFIPKYIILEKLILRL